MVIEVGFLIVCWGESPMDSVEDDCWQFGSVFLSSKSLALLNRHSEALQSWVLHTGREHKKELDRMEKASSTHFCPGLLAVSFAS